jgi:hypothetical protein
MRLLLPLVLLCGCATFRPDPVCDRLIEQGVRVRVEPGTMLSCDEALGLTERSLAAIRHAGLTEPRDWDVLFTWRMVGSGIMENGTPAWGITHAREHRTWVRVSYFQDFSSPPEAVFHELLHASEALDGRADADHSDWCSRHLDALEIHRDGSPGVPMPLT